jgi:O-antigen/teichoic acid export membrane protein
MTDDSGMTPASTAIPSVLGRNRSAWTFADQALSSGQSLAISLVITHLVGLRGVGAFAIVFSVYQIMLVINRPLNGDPLTVGFSAASRSAKRAAAASASGGAVFLGFCAATIGVACGFGIRGSIGTALVAFSVAIPVFLLQDNWRCVFLTMGRPARAFANDAIVLMSLIPTCLVANEIAPRSAAAFVGAWGGATGVGAAMGVFQSGILPRVNLAVRWWKSTLHFGIKVLAENLLINVTYFAGVATIVVISGAPQLGRLRTAQVVTGLATPIILAVALVVLADGSRLLESNPRRFPRVVLLGLIATVGVALGAGLIWYWLPVHLGTILIGANWSKARPLVIGASAFAAAGGATLTLSSSLRAMRFPGDALICRVIVAPMTVGAAVFGGLLRGPVGAIWGLAITEILCALLLAVRFAMIWRSGRWRTRDPVSRGQSRIDDPSRVV